MNESYRESHQAKGADYDETFSTLPHRAMMWRLERRLLTSLIGELFAGRQPTHLDFACGTGRILGHLAPCVRHPVGVDVSASMLALARERLPRAEIIEADLTRGDPLGERRFELITAFRFFPNAEPELRAAAIRALVKHLARGGFLVFNNHKHDASLQRRVAGWLGRTPPVAEAEARGDRSMSHAEVEELVSGAGLRIVSRHPLAMLPFSDRHILRPVWLLELVERGLALLPASAAVAQNIVYVCEKSGSEPSHTKLQRG